MSAQWTAPAGDLAGPPAAQPCSDLTRFLAGELADHAGLGDRVVRAQREQ
jgi:hypothetical protein